MILLAIDPGTNILGWARFNLETKELLDAGSIKAAAKLDRLQRSIFILNTLKKDLNGKVTLVICEEPLLKGVANKAMERLLGMIEYAVYPVKQIYYAPATIKKTMGSGSLDKQEMLKALKKMLKNNKIVKQAEKDPDAIDAICVGLTYFKAQSDE